MPRNALPCCICALDGISTKIKKPDVDEQPASFYCRKGFYTIPVQALFDLNYRFICFSARRCGSTHDSLAPSVSALSEYLESGDLDSYFWIVGDEAYICTKTRIIPFPATQCTDSKAAFNCFLSSLRMHIEQFFGMLMSKRHML